MNKDLVMSEEMQEHLELHRRLNLTPSMLSAIEPDGRYSWLNDVALQYFGLSAADSTSGDLRRRVVLPDDFERVREARQRALDSGSPFEYENRLRRHDGQYRWFLVRYQPLKDEAGRVVRWYGSATDIEDQKRAQVGLRRSEAYLAEAQILSHTGSWAYTGKTGDWAVRYWSEENYRIWGFDPAEGLPTTGMIRQRLHPDDRERAIEKGEEARRAETDYSNDFRIVFTDGSVRHIRSVAHSMFSITDNCMEMIGTHVDMTENKRAEEERARLRMDHLAREFELSVEARVAERTRIARELHDTLLQSFNALLLRFQTVSDLLPTRHAEAKEILAGAIDQANKAITEGREAVEGLRTSAQKPNDLVTAIERLGKDLAADSAADHAASIRVDADGASRPLHPIVRDEVYRIAGEAMRNAFQHSNSKQILVELRYDKQQFCLLIRDDGKGIDAEMLTESGREGHYGLRGMRERADLIGGKLELRTEPGAGTEVELTIGASQAYATAPTAKSHKRNKQ